MMMDVNEFKINDNMLNELINTATVFINKIESHKVLNNLDKIPLSDDIIIDKDLLKVIRYLSLTGIVLIEWKYLKIIIFCQLLNCIRMYSLENIEKKIIKTNLDRFLISMNNYTDAPFTAQRLCEIILKPKKHYNSLTKLLFGIEKLLSVSTTIKVSNDSSKIALELNEKFKDTVKTELLNAKNDKNTLLKIYEK